MARYLVDPEHPLLSATAQALEPEVLDAHAVVAERVLGLADIKFTGTDAEEAANAAALQVNYQVNLPPEVYALQSETRGARRVEYRFTGAPVLNPIAVAMAGALLGTVAGGWLMAGPRR